MFCLPSLAIIVCLCSCPRKTRGGGMFPFQLVLLLGAAADADAAASYIRMLPSSTGPAATGDGDLERPRRYAGGGEVERPRLGLWLRCLRFGLRLRDFARLP
mmetsp:Transcript_54555/g.132456  ORF Transcript_54555/g.132456 Transcript_54555/m.132456 type:complete len:102 (-) Transcript_54555:778-1083(-)